MAAAMNYEDLKKTLDKLEKRGKLGTSDSMMYFFSSFLQGLGYNTFDVDAVDVRNADGEVYAKITDDLNLVVSLYGHFPLNNEKDRIFLSLRLEERKIKLYFKVLGEWEEIVSLDIKKDDAEKYTHKLVRRIMRDQVLQSYKSKGEKFLTENVFDSMIEKGQWDNDFMLLGLLEELKNPTKEFTNLMANRMYKDYTTRDREWIVKHIKPMENKGLVSVVEKMIKQGYIAKDSEDTVEDDQGGSQEYSYNDHQENNKFTGPKFKPYSEPVEEKQVFEKPVEKTPVEPPKPKVKEESKPEEDIDNLTFGESGDDLDFGEKLTFGEGEGDEFLDFKEDDDIDSKYGKETIVEDDRTEDSGDSVDLTNLLNTD